MTTNKTPAELGYRWPAEWERHAATWLSWPHNRETWPGAFEEAVAQYVEFAAAIARFEPVHILAAGPAWELADASVGGLENVAIHSVPTNDAWIRDHGPIFLKHADNRQPPMLLDWQYNAWGGKYPPFGDDQDVPRHVSAITENHRRAMNVVLEGGAIDGNGEGVVLTTASCLLNKNRNPNLDRWEFERILASNLGASEIIWIDRQAAFELPGDDTDGHVDQLARFVDRETILIADPNGGGQTRNQTRLADQFPDRFKIRELPIPAEQSFSNSRLPLSYANFYIVNGAVLVPTFDDPADSLAAEIIGDCFPDRQIICLSANRLAVGLGAFHCLTQQQPE